MAYEQFAHPTDRHPVWDTNEFRKPSPITTIDQAEHATTHGELCLCDLEDSTEIVFEYPLAGCTHCQMPGYLGHRCDCGGHFEV